jgi:predicted TIM-barrel fold metal-dependent hydrolase
MWRGMKRTPEECLHENLAVTTSDNFSAPSLICTMAMLGPDKVMFSVDWPYESNLVGVTCLTTCP